MDDMTNTQAPERETNPRREAFHKLMHLNHLSMALHHKRMSEGGPAGDPMRGRGRVIALLQLKDGITTREIAGVIGVRTSSLNEVLARLERDGLVRREPNEQDRRQTLVYLTDEGRAQESTHVRPHERLLAGFSDEEVEQLSGYLDRLAQAMEGELGEDGRAMLEESRRRRAEMFGGPHHHRRLVHG